MKKISLILLALFLLQGSEKCEAGGRRAPITQTPPVLPSEDEEKKKKEKEKEEEENKKKEKEEEENKKKEKEEENKRIAEENKRIAEENKKKEAEEQKKIEEGQKKIEEENKKKEAEEQKKIEETKNKNDSLQIEIEGYEKGTLPEEILTEIANLKIDNFYTKKTINNIIKTNLNEEIAHNQFQKALDKLGIQNNSEGLHQIHEHKVQYEKQRSELSKENSDKDLLVLEAQMLARKRILDALENVITKKNSNATMSALQKSITDPVVSTEIKTLYENSKKDINSFLSSGSKDALQNVQLKKALEPLGILVKQELEKGTKELDDINKNRQKEESVGTIITTLKKLEEYIAQNLSASIMPSVSQSASQNKKNNQYRNNQYRNNQYRNNQYRNNQSNIIKIKETKI